MEGNNRPLRVLAWPPGAPTDLNPYVRLMYQAFRPPQALLIPYRASMLNPPQADVFHIQWPEAIFWGSGRLSPVIASLLAVNVLRTADGVRRGGGILVQTIHNLEPHAKLSPLALQIWVRYRCALLARTDALIGLTSSSLQDVRAVLPGAAELPSFVIPHPHYRGAYPFPPTREAARQTFQLSNDECVLGMIGSIRASKSVPRAIDAFKAVAAARDRLLIAGACDDEKLWGEVSSAQRNDPRILLRRDYLTDDAIASAIAACDVILLNQVTTLNSGTALLALSLNRPVIAPAQGSLVDLARQLGEEWVALFETPLDSSKLRNCVSSLLQKARPPEAPLQYSEPSKVSQDLLSVFVKARTARPDPSDLA